MKVSFFPKSKIGKWSSYLFLVEVAMIIIFYSILAIFDVKGGDTFFSNPELFIPLLIAWVSGAAAFVFGVISTIKNKPKSILVIAITLITLLTTWFGIAEIVFPH